MFGDYSLTCPTVLFGGYAVKAQRFKGKVYQYRLTYGSSQSLSSYSNWAQVSHTDELPLVFGVPFKPIEELLWNWKDRKISKQVMDIWTHFAKHDEILTINGNAWPEYEIDDISNMINAKYIEFHAEDKRMGRVYQNCCQGSVERITQTLINNCFNFWDQVISEQF